MIVPSVIAQLITLVYNIIDHIFIGHIPKVGSVALTGIGVCMPVTLIISAFAQLVRVGRTRYGAGVYKCQYEDHCSWRGFEHHT